MFIRVKSTPNSPRKSVQICENVREGSSVRQKIVRHVGIAKDEAHLKQLKKLAKSLKEQIKEETEGPFLFPVQELGKVDKQLLVTPNKQTEPSPRTEPSLQVDLHKLKEEKRIVEGFHETFGRLFEELGFNSLLSKKKNEVLKDIILARIANPLSKLGTQVVLAADFGREIPLDRVYRMMDALELNGEKVQKSVFAATQRFCFEQVNVLLFDVTTLYFESVEEDDLRAFGYSKDQKFHTVQVVFALATTQEGLPVGYRLFRGNTAEVSTLLTAIEEWKQVLSIGRVVFVADRGMMTEKNLCALEESGIDYVVAAKLRKLPQQVQQQVLASCTKEKTVCLDVCLANRRRLVVSYQENRARKDRADRERIIEKMRKKIGQGKSAKRLISNRGYQKYIRVEGKSRLLIDEEKLRMEEAWDGLHGVLTNLQDSQAEELLSRYKNLWVIEDSFRIHKHDLRVRPIYHFKSERIEAHMLICYLAFCLTRHMQYRMSLQQESVSLRQMRESLWRVQASVLLDKESGERYRVPSVLRGIAKQIYQALGVKRGDTPKKL